MWKYQSSIIDAEQIPDYWNFIKSHVHVISFIHSLTSISEMIFKNSSTVAKNANEQHIQ